MSVELIILVFSTLVSLLVGLFVFAKNPRNIISQVYAILTACLMLYPIFNYLSLQTADRLTPIRLVILFATLSVYFQYLLACILAGNINKKLHKRLLLITCVVALLNVTPLVFNGLTEGDNPVPTPGVLAPTFLIHFVILIGLTLTKLVRSLRKFSGQKRAQFQLLVIGMIPIFALSPITSFVMPVILKNSSLIFLSPVYGAFFVCMVGYAIVKHKLFDIRLIVARSVGYLLAISVLAGLYSGSAYLILNYFLPDDISQLTESSINILLLVLAAGSFGHLRRRFDQITNRLFYRDAYDSQVFLDEFNREIVSSVDLQIMLNRCADIITRNLKSEFCLFGLKETDYSPQRIIGNSNIKFDTQDISEVRAITPHSHKVVHVTDELDERDVLRRKLQKYDIAILARLTANPENDIEGLGYLVLGPKKSGNPYNKQDTGLIEIIANELVIAIQNALRFEEIEKFNITLQEKVENATRRLRHTNQKLKELDEIKDDFISMASHQLRTPLTSVKGYISMVLDGDAGKKPTPMQRKLLDQAFISSQRMVYLIADLLNVSRLKTGKFVIERGPTNLAEVVQGEVEQLKETAASRKLRLVYDKPADFPSLLLDETKIRQVIMNFVDNAIYYTPAGGTIRIAVIDKPKSVEFRVKDDGIGVPKAERHKLFTKFYRAPNAKKARPDGTGLGLFMAQKVIVAQGGGIIFESQEGKGSTFGFTFDKNRLKLPEITPKN